MYEKRRKTRDIVNQAYEAACIPCGTKLDKFRKPRIEAIPAE